MPNLTTMVSTDGLRYICQEAGNNMPLLTGTSSSEPLPWSSSYLGYLIALGAFVLLIVFGLALRWARCEKLRRERLTRDMQEKEGRVRGLMEGIVLDGRNVLRFIEEVENRDEGVGGCFKGEEGWHFVG